MNPVSVDIKDMLVAESLESDSTLNLVFGQNLFIGNEPANPHTAVTIFDTTARAPQLTIKQGENYYYEAVQIRVRARDYMEAWELIRNIQTSLHGRAHEPWNGALYTVIFCSSGPAMLDWDNNNRIRLIINFETQRR